ncbi:MAG: XRE family transcriptional regulator [Deltaproteobacteria bacterium]|nr:XRE family transcriptional regulator [Deltaproteobacteria bacterium]
MDEKYEIRLYDTPLVRFDFIGGSLSDAPVKNVEILGSDPVVFPLDLELTSAGVYRWLGRRVIPKNREFVEQILLTFGLMTNNMKGIIKVCKGLSLNDSYWVVPVDFEGTFEQYNLYENRFSEILALVAYTGVNASDPAFSTSPELTTNGMLPKAWRFIEHDGIYLYKGGTSGAANTGKEPYSEFYASQVATRMGLNAIKYDLEQWKGILASKCKLFTDIDTAYIPAGRIITSGGLKAVADYYDSLGQSFSDEIRDMLVFDALIYNTDRHFGNFGVLRDSRSGSIIAPAPIFDNGMSLFNYATHDSFRDLDEYSKTRLPAYDDVSYEAIVKTFVTQRQVEQLRKMINFKFTRHFQYNLPEERLVALENHLQKRMRQLLEIARVRDKSKAKSKVKTATKATREKDLIGDLNRIKRQQAEQKAKEPVGAASQTLAKRKSKGSER